MARTGSILFRNLAARFLHNSGGNTAIIFALALIPIMSGIGAAVDFSHGGSMKAAMQSALDAAALNVVKDAGRLSNAEIKSKAGEVFAANFNQPEATNVDIKAQFDPGKAVLTLNGSTTVKTMFMGVMGINEMQIAAMAKAQGLKEDGACLIALDATANDAFRVAGAGTVKVPNCGIYINSSGSTALSQVGSGWIRAKSISVVGGAASGNYFPSPQTHQKPIPDPLGEIPEPVVPSSCNYKDTTFSVPMNIPGGTVYCGKIAFNGNVTFGAGMHFFKGAEVVTGSDVRIVGTDITLYFDENSTLDSTGTGYVQLQAPQTGTYEGITMFRSRKGNLATFKLTGSKDYFVRGSLYLPTVHLQLYGNFDLMAESRSGYIIAQKFLYQGDPSFHFDAFGSTVPSGINATRSVLVE